MALGMAALRRAQCIAPLPGGGWLCDGRWVRGVWWGECGGEWGWEWKWGGVWGDGNFWGGAGVVML